MHSYLEQVADSIDPTVDLKLASTRKNFRRYVVAVCVKAERKWLRRDGYQLVKVGRVKRLTLPDKLQVDLVVYAVQWVVRHVVSIHQRIRVTCRSMLYMKPYYTLKKIVFFVCFVVLRIYLVCGFEEEDSLEN